ncbi:11252_t:CDS:2 [Acaulospora morrowiae]|uniref:11252_t:CDS:1 n=1 Tax=Acaulospora morrowiae TaxID=94023 RepID=A0A9N9GN14_9GLOM|nr:11252_t:CDS:2 [Acaulospora morrowiae]
MPMEVDVNDEAAVMMLSSWSMISRMDQSTTIALLSYVSSDGSQYPIDKKVSPTDKDNEKESLWKSSATEPINHPHEATSKPTKT